MTRKNRIKKARQPVGAVVLELPLTAPPSSNVPATTPRSSSGWSVPTTWISLISLFASLTSLFLSSKSFRVASAAYSQSHADFVGSRLAILEGHVDDANNEIVFAPTDPNIHLQAATVYFPKELTDPEWRIMPPKLSLPVSVLRYSLIKRVDGEFPKRSNFVQLMPDFGVPLIVDSVYTTKGQVYQDRSMYVLTATVVIDDKPHSSATVSFKGLLFSGHIDGTNTPDETLGDTWKQMETSLLSHRNQ